jgi:uncharacterized protein (DUF2236 family)
MSPEDLRSSGPELDPLAVSARAVIDGARERVREASIGLPDEGYFPPGSALRMVQRSRRVGLLYGQVGLAIGGTDPLNYIGNSEHSRNKDIPFQRLAETAQLFETIFFDSREAADSVVDQVFLMHTRVKGTTSEAVGPHPKGTAYAAFDTDRALWTIGCMADPAIRLYEKLERPLAGEEREAFWQDYRLFGELFGVPRDKTPPTYPEFQAYMQERLSSNELYLTPSAKYLGEQVCFHTPIPRFPKCCLLKYELCMGCRSTQCRRGPLH